MRIQQRFLAIITLASLSILAAELMYRPGAIGQAPDFAARESAYRANNIGVALLEQFKYKEAAEEFRRALAINPQLAMARLNLSIALYNDRELAAALREAKAAAEALPSAPQPHYMLGLIARAQNRYADAIAAFQRVLEIDPQDVGANVNLGQLLMQEGKHAEAVSHFRAALAAEPYNVTATYNLALALIRVGQREQGARMMQRFQALRQAGYGTTLGQNYLEQGRYAEAISSTGAEPELVEAVTPDVKFTPASAAIKAAAGEKIPDLPVSAFERSMKTSELDETTRRKLAAALGGSVTLFDMDGDGDLDLFVVGPFAQRLYRNDGGKFVDVTEGSGLSSVSKTAIGMGAIAGDYDNDGRADLFVLRYGGCSLYHNDGNGKFSDVTAAAGIPAYPHLALSVAFADVDHDGDLDIFIAGFADLTKTSASSPDQVLNFPADFAAAPNLLLRNDGNGKFTDITAAAKVTGPNRAVAVVATDYNNRRDIDLFVLNYGSPPVLYSNMRDGTFRDVAAEVGLTTKDRFTCVAAGDVNKDGFTDFFLGRAGGPGLFAMSDGREHLKLVTAPRGSEDASAAQFIDYDNDGLLDLVLFSKGGMKVLRNVGNNWADVSDRAVARELSVALAQSPRGFASGDIDGDGDTDLVVRLAAGQLEVARNDGGNHNAFLRIQIAGKVSNRSGVGAKIEMRAGSLRQKLEVYSASPAPAPADVLFGLGKRANADAVRVLWPSGIVQAETIAKSIQAMNVTELDRKPSSCPYLFAWNGERFEFITDFMGGGEMGYWEEPGKYNRPDPDEYVRIREDQLKPRNGRYELRVTNELEEVLYIDRLQLVAVDHPSDIEVYPNEGMIDPPRQFKLFAVGNAHPPSSAEDEHGHDVLARISRLDRTYPDDFKLLPIRGYAEQHWLTLDLGKPEGKCTLLLLTGWTDYAFSSDNVAAYQSGLTMKPPALQVKDANGNWRTIIPNIGIPVGRPQTIVIELADGFFSTNRQVRIITNMRIYWDQILVAEPARRVPLRMTRLEPVRAELRWRGFSAEVSPDGRQPFSYDYARVSPLSPWKVMPGRYTREGDVRELLMRTDDMFVISRPGDEISLSFDATKLAVLPRGWKRTFMLYADGFSKEMDINSASPDTATPLPFHAMKSYPYAAPQYPADRAHRRYIERYNTRVVVAPLPAIEAMFARK
jgi:Tfp pilus assembly protein PilF